MLVFIHLQCPCSSSISPQRPQNTIVLSGSLLFLFHHSPYTRPIGLFGRSKTFTGWIALAIFFHIATYLVVGPNFVRQVPLLLMLLHGVWHPTIGAAKEVIEPEQRIAWRWRVGYATALLLLFLCAQVWSDISHIVGATPYLGCCGENGFSIHVYNP